MANIIAIGPWANRHVGRDGVGGNRKSEESLGEEVNIF
jgi:hypothetical protein